MPAEPGIFLKSLLNTHEIHLHSFYKYNKFTRSLFPTNISAVSIEINGNRNLQVSVDGKIFDLRNSATSGTKTSIAFNNLGSGQHTIQITRTEAIPGIKETIPVLFNSGMDLTC
jgi:hypothetical protein